MSSNKKLLILIPILLIPAIIIIGILSLLALVILYFVFVPYQPELAEVDNPNTVSFEKFIEITNRDFEDLKVDQNGCYEFEYYDKSIDGCDMEVECFTDQHCQRVEEI